MNNLVAIETIFVNTLFWGVLAACVFFWTEIIAKQAWARLAGALAMGVGLVGSIGAMVMRYVYAGYPPLSNLFESLLGLIFALLAIYLFIEWRMKPKYFGAAAAPLAFLLIGFASILPARLKDAHPLMPALQSYWLKIHVSLMLISYAAFFLAFGAAVVYLILHYRDKRNDQGGTGGGGTLARGAAAANAGAAQLRDGLQTLSSGTAELRDGLADGVQAIPASTPDLRSLQADTIADPVKVSSDKVASAEDYGAGLAPFFAALSAWIGIYALFLIVKPISRRAVTALHSPIRITLAGWLTPAMLGAVQMLGLMGILALTLGFTFDHPLGTLGVMMFASATFAAIILALNVWLGSVGQFLGLVLMVLQLVTAGGTFPWQTLPAPLAALHHVLPLGYVVDAMRQLMYGGDYARAGWDLAVLGAWLAGALLLAMIGVTRMTHRRTLRDLQPSLIG